MKKLGFGFFLVLLAASVVFAGGQKDADDGTARITVASDATWPPMEFVDATGVIVGFDIDLLNAVAEAGGFEVEVQNTAWDGIFAGLANGDYDAVISSVTITEERQRTMAFSTPYINAGQVLIVPAGSSAKNLSDLSGQQVGAQIGTTGAFEIEKVAGVTLLTYDEIGLAVEDLANGRISGVVCDSPIAADYVLQNDNYSNKLQIAGDPFTEEFFGIAVQKGNEEVLEMINAGLQVILNDGTVEDLKDKWLR